MKELKKFLQMSYKVLHFAIIIIIARKFRFYYKERAGIFHVI